MKTKVAIVAYSAPPYSSGGVASAHYNLFRALRSAGYDARLFTFGDRQKGRDKIIVRNGTPRWTENLVRRFCKLFFLILAPGKVAYQTADILSSQWGARLMNKAIEEFKPSAVILSDHGAPGFSLNKHAGVKLILVSHHNPARFISHPEITNYSALDARIAIWLEQFAVGKTDLVACPSAYMKKWFLRTYRFSGLVRVIPNLLDDKLLNEIPAGKLRARLKLRAKDTLIYMPSAGSKLKGAGDLPQIVSNVSMTDGRVAFYIPGPKVGFTNDAQVYSPGQLSYREHISNMKVCDFGISPSLMENFSMALLEAVSAGVPMVAYDTGGNSEIIKNGKNGLLAKEGDLAGLIAQAKRLIDPKYRKNFRRQTKLFSRDHFSAKKTVQAYAKLIESNGKN